MKNHPAITLLLVSVLMIVCSCQTSEGDLVVRQNENPSPEPDTTPSPDSAPEYRTPCVDPLESELPYFIKHNTHPEKTIISVDRILDCSMVPIGAPYAYDEGYQIVRDPEILYHGIPSYYFKMESDARTRVELQSLFVTQADLDEVGLTKQDIQDHIATKTLYHFGKGEAKKGETWSYEYGLYLTEELRTMSGIISQWHGMPDKTTLVTPANDTIYVPHKEFVDDYLSVMYFNEAIGYNKSDDTVNGYIVDAGGNPPMGLKVKNGYLHLVCMIDRARVHSSTKERIHIYPPNNFPESATSPEGNKTVYGLWAQKLSELPVEQWIDMKFVVRWSNFAADGSGVLDEGIVKFYMNGELKVDWTGYIGNNDEHGTYFKYGLYVPESNGLEVRVGDFRQTKIE
ncbi:polysaccharide lyase [Marinoscillum sp. MHG1-6]|uniref:polysaccharide lyase n=1 Tax=Marinoscillum sp. MHG1-6 TaxID=2959627 RepID=UPI0021582A58|nr:polysaccharide lyase [Marinoscillum sp. MHG1-6]